MLLMNYLFFLSLSFLFICCSSLPKEQQKISLHFLDEYVYPINQTIKKTKIGGLSGIDYKNGIYYLAVDDSKTPRYCKAKINIKNGDFTHQISHCQAKFSFCWVVGEFIWDNLS